MKDSIVIFWFRRDLRLSDNHGLFQALTFAKQHKVNVLPLFIFDRNILKHLKNDDDARISFIHRTLDNIKSELNNIGSDLKVFHGDVLEVWSQLHKKFNIHSVYCNRDYEPVTRKRDILVQKQLKKFGINFLDFKDQVIFETNNILKKDGKPYLVYTPYKNKWLENFGPENLSPYPSEDLLNFMSKSPRSKSISLKTLGFKNTKTSMPNAIINLDIIKNYKEQRDIPSINGTSKLGLHLRFGTISIRECAKNAFIHNDVWLSELIWREFFMQILYHFPHVTKKCFRPKYEAIPWLNNRSDFKKWCEGKTGYPMVDAGMRELNQTGHMHNRVRMVVASFLVKHLLIDWRWGERYFAQHLLDYDLAANNGNWQWAAGTGCDAAPYFRVFNPTLQAKRFDPEHKYIKKWIPEFGTSAYPSPIVEHRSASQRAIATYKEALN